MLLIVLKCIQITVLFPKLTKSQEMIWGWKLHFTCPGLRKYWTAPVARSATLFPTKGNADFNTLIKTERAKNSASTLRWWTSWVTAKPLPPNTCLSNFKTKFFRTLSSKPLFFFFFEPPHKSWGKFKIETHCSEVHNSFLKTPFCSINTCNETKENNWIPKYYRSIWPQGLQPPVAGYFRYFSTI